MVERVMNRLAATPWNIIHLECFCTGGLLAALGFALSSRALGATGAMVAVCAPVAYAAGKAGEWLADRTFHSK